MLLKAEAKPAKGLLKLYLGLSLFAVLYLPYFFPVAPSTSDSYIFGYNNKVGVILLLLLASIGAIWTKGLNFEFSPAGPSPKAPLKFLWLSLFLEFAACATMYLRTGRYIPFAEAEYEINRIWLVSLGKRPYIDFEWSWGPGLLYFPKWMSELFRLSIPHGYYLFWVIMSLVGIALLYATVNLVDFPSRRKTAIFLLLSTCAFLSTMSLGVNYTLLRYLCPLFCILLVDKANRKSHGPGAGAVAAVLAVAFTFLLLMISPEVMIAHAFACLIVLFPGKLASVQREKIYVYSGMLAVMAALFAVGFKTHIFDTIRMDGRGANSFPLTLSWAPLMFFLTIFICACYLVQRFNSDGIQDNTVALIAFSIPMTAAALGRSDPGHILLNGIGFFIAGLFYASASRRMWRLYFAGFVATFLIVCEIPGILMSVKALNASALPSFPSNPDISLFYPKSVRLNAGEQFLAPFGYAPEAKGYYYSSQIDYGYFDGASTNVNTPDAIRLQIAELAQHPQEDLLLRKDFPVACQLTERHERVIVSFLVAFPYTARVVHLESIRKPLCDYIFAHYFLAENATDTSFRYALWRPKA